MLITLWMKPVHSIVGNPSTGKSNVLKILLKQFSGEPCFIVDSREMEALVAKAMEYGITFICTTLPTKMRGYDNMTKLLRDGQAGVILGIPSDQGILPVSTPKNFKASPEIVCWYKRGDVKQVKIPFVG